MTDDLLSYFFLWNTCDAITKSSKKVTTIKISMEKSKHLMGVTMQEPGVSRMVAVDVDEAVKLSASA